MRRVYLIDLENVQSAGLDGIDQLTGDDSIYIFYSDKADNLKVDLVRKILESPAKVDFVKANNGTPNALDFQLISYLFYHVEADTQYWIVSKDTGYDAAIKMGKRMGLLNVRRAPAIKNAVHFGMRANKIAAYRAAKAAEKEAEDELQTAEEEEAEAVQIEDAEPEEIDSEETETETAETEAEDTEAAEEAAAEEEEEEEQEGPFTEETEESEVQQTEAEAEEESGTKDTENDKVINLKAGHAKQADKENGSFRASLSEILGQECNVATDPETLNLVEDGLRRCSNKGQFYQFFRRRMGAARGGAFYKSLRGQFDTMKKLLAE